MALHGFVLAGGPTPNPSENCDTQLLLVVLLAGGVTYSQYHHVLAHVVKSVSRAKPVNPDRVVPMLPSTTHLDLDPVQFSSRAH